MTRSLLTMAILILSVFAGLAPARQTQPSDAVDLAPGFKMRASGGIDIGDIYAEVVQFGADWKETEEHDVFNPSVATPDANSHVVTGVFTCPAGPLNLTEHISTIDGGISFSADVSSATGLQCNELSVAFTLPVATVGGKQILIDDQPL